MWITLFDCMNKVSYLGDLNTTTMTNKSTSKFISTMFTRYISGTEVEYHNSLTKCIVRIDKVLPPTNGYDYRVNCTVIRYERIERVRDPHTYSAVRDENGCYVYRTIEIKGGCSRSRVNTLNRCIRHVVRQQLGSSGEIFSVPLWRIRVDKIKWDN